MSSVLNVIWTALRGGAREMGGAIVDSNGIRILEQEIKLAKEKIEQAKKNLAEVMASRMQSERKLSQLTDDIHQHESYAGKALEQEVEALALVVAGKIAVMENEKSEQMTTVSRLDSQIRQLKSHVKSAEKLIADHERELSIIRTTESVQKATEQVVENVAANNSSLNSARDSLERIKQRQEMKQDQMEAGELLKSEADGNQLETKLQEAGIVGGQADASAILERIKSSRK
ncbi:PspA/IM30 family protein [Ketobacter sp. MCCC 1A13808]|uniref:PspA/IM30 family protein n=1 Tax=Ketobacter sp. MCCC 1A13808 TaxID=2602738 RepID=UPI0012EC3136|nr:PspA/IM30 family protein [Ketobacter sp. MCCC 1A13808]MVF11802.1 PspA/IM30 family protein [Ketobacter sp. MCCC 1A13808]